MEITATGNNMLHGTAQGILLVVVRGTSDALRTVKLPCCWCQNYKGIYFRVWPQLRKALKQSLNRRAHLSILERSVFSSHDWI